MKTTSRLQRAIDDAMTAIAFAIATVKSGWECYQAHKTARQWEEAGRTLH